MDHEQVVELKKELNIRTTEVFRGTNVGKLRFQNHTAHISPVDEREGIFNVQLEGLHEVD